MLHVTTREIWDSADGRLSPPAGGFIHLCTDGQLAFVLERHFAGHTGLLLLRLDPAGLDVRWEESEPGLPPFPHLYGDLPSTSVREVVPL